MHQDPLSSADALRNAFASGLERILKDEDGLGPFILVLANATFDPGIHDRLRHDLARRFGELAERCRRAFIAGRQPAEPEDDLSVFLRLMAIGFDHIESSRWRRLDPWEIQFNQVRSLRPQRAASHRPSGIRAPFDANGFQFNKPFLRKETFWQGRLAGVEVDLLFNKFPFVDLHALVVPDRLASEPQHLSRHRHQFVWALTERLAPRLPGIGFAYNSYGAFASVNHLHFQMFLRERPLPVSLKRWRHNGGAESYPACCERYETEGAAWGRIADLHAQGLGYNLVYLADRFYCLPRRCQGTYELPPWSGGQAWYEMTGGVVAFNADDFLSVGAEDVREALALTAEGLAD
ncbi:MAG: hypothetical protein U9Q81_16845 [Pseudomonadota bacterium]|nr:hypothetical protein [Pseudomonadota bacterium]